MSKKGHIPIRTCIGCKKKRKKEEMVWFKQSIDGGAPVNEKKNIGGRGFYLCPSPICFKKAQKSKRMGWVFTDHPIVFPSEENWFIGERF